MFRLTSLFYPWGIVLQVLAVIHFMRRRPDNYWIYIIFFGGPIGAAAYIVMEILPDAKLLGDIFQGFGRRSRIQQLEIQIIDNPSPGNFEELGDLWFDQRNFAKAREAYTKAIVARSDLPHTFYRRGQCALALGDLASAIPDLEHAINKDVKFDYYRAAGLLADAYARTGQIDRARELFVIVTQYSTTPETLYNYANFLKLSGQADLAREWTEKLLAKKRTLPRYLQRVERPWFRRGKALLRQLSPAKQGT